MTLQRIKQRREAWVRLTSLLRLRNSKMIIEAGKDWLDKEIADLEDFLKSKSGRVYKRKMTTLRDAAIQCKNKFSRLA